MKTKSIWSQFWGSITFTVLALIAGTIYGGAQGGFAAGVTALFTVAFLGILETTLSLDNAVVNAKILKTWSPFWRKLFLTVGILVAVVGMRLVFPVLIVAVAASISIPDTINLALTDPAGYGHKLHEIHYLVAGYGGAFLLMVTLGFFLKEKQVYWWEWAERKLEKAGELESLSSIAALLLSLAIAPFTPHPTEFFMAAFWGVTTYVLVHGVSSLMEQEDDEGEVQPNPIGQGVKAVATGGSIWAFLYLEVLDASFSFDGVIGAFAITNNIVIIMLGLAIGAMFVRSMTIYLVNQGTLSEYRYLEHGAFAAIGVLVAIMYISATGIEIPEAISGLSGLALIGGALWQSIRANKKDAAAAAAP